MNATQQLHALGQSLWLDNITHGLLTSGTLARYIRELAVTGLTSNPTIFDQAIKDGEFYDDAIEQRGILMSSDPVLDYLIRLLRPLLAPAARRAPRSRFSSADIHGVLDDAFNDYERQRPRLPKEKEFGARLMVHFAALTAGVYRSLHRHPLAGRQVL